MTPYFGLTWIKKPFKKAAPVNRFENNIFTISKLAVAVRGQNLIFFKAEKTNQSIQVQNATKSKF